MTQIPSLAFQRGEAIQFIGAKVTLFVGDRLVTIQRDETPNIPWPGFWDLPGGGRENKESPFECVVRETFEEITLTLRKADFLWARAYFSNDHDRWFFVARISEVRASDIQLGEEGQQIQMMTPGEYLKHETAVPNFQRRLADWIAGL